jgi:glycerol-3-phosphate dehydrogenase
MGHIGVVGGGAWGTALACLARRAGRRVTLWSRDPAISTAIAHDRANPVYLPGIVLDAGTNYADSSVQGGQIYYYVTTSVDSTSAQSPYSNETQAVIPAP